MKKTFRSIIALMCAILTIACLLTSCGSDSGKTDAIEGGSDAVENEENDAAEVDTTATQVDKAAEVDNAIATIGTVTLESKDAIAEAKAAYNALSTEDKAKVANYSVLEAAETEYKALVDAEKANVLETYKSKFNVEVDKVQKLSWYMPKNMPEYIDERCYVIPYIGIQNDNIWVAVRYNYTEDDWIFWENLTIVADDETFYKTVGYYNTVRDNDAGYVWEYYDDTFNYNESIDSTSFKQLKAMADATETIIRFEGDDYYYDLTLSSADKAMINDVLDMYEAYTKY